MIARSPDGDVTAEFRRKVGHLLSPMTRRSFQEQTIFWGPEALPTVMPVAVTAAPRSIGVVARPLLDLAAGQVRRAADGWRAVLRIGAVEHRVWSKDPPALGAGYISELPIDSDFAERAYAARRLWRAMNGAGSGPLFMTCPSRGASA